MKHLGKYKDPGKEYERERETLHVELIWDTNSLNGLCQGNIPVSKAAAQWQLQKHTAS